MSRALQGPSLAAVSKGTRGLPLNFTASPLEHAGLAMYIIPTSPPNTYLIVPAINPHF